MAIKHNNIIANVHFRKWWQRYVKTWFNQAGRKKSRRVARQQRAATKFPRPNGTLRPAVHPPTQRYNFKLRSGRGFTLDELKKAGIPRKQAKTIGICVDHRRRNHCEESLKLNADRLTEYKSKLMVFPKKNKAKKGDTARSEMKNVKQVIKCKTVLPLPKNNFFSEKARAVSGEEKEQNTYRIMRKFRAEKRNFGTMIKKALEKKEGEKK